MSDTYEFIYAILGELKLRHNYEPANGVDIQSLVSQEQ